MRMKMVLVILSCLLLAGCTKAEIVFKRDSGVIMAYPEPRMDMRYHYNGGYPYPIAY